MTELTTARLQMRLFTLDDDDKLVRLHGDAELMAHMRGGVQSRAEAAAELARYRACWAEQGFGIWALFTGGNFIGECGLRMPFGDAEGIRLRFVIDKPYQGRGFAGEAAAAALGFAFEAAGLDLVRAVSREHNPASQHVLERAGMTVEQLTCNDRGIAIRIYAITRDAWELR
jgi:ribosomal-protein-alanine N-acetyltransferase